MIPEVIEDKGGPTEAARVFPWNAPKKSVNPYLDPAEVASVSALSNLITLYAADSEQEQLYREALSDEVWERYIFNEFRDPVQREMKQDQLISCAKMAREQQRFNPDLVILANVSNEPFAIREDRVELGNNTGPRFKSELINLHKGTPTSYIAKYISKNIDGCGLTKVSSKETGKSLRGSVEHVSAWASLHRVQQFRLFGIPRR